MTEATPLSELTTTRVGGAPERLITATTQRDLVDAALSVWENGEELLVLGGGSNLLVGDEPLAATVIRVATRGIERLPSADGTVRLRVQAGEPWDDLVTYTVRNGWSGLEALSGIPGLAGAAPMQNIGAYGQEVAGVLRSIELLDYEAGEVIAVPAEELELGYRTSTLKHGGRVGIVISIELELHDTGPERTVLGEALGIPIAYAQLAATLGVQPGDRVPVSAVRDAVLTLRASKGMVLNAADHDTWSTGSFFTNPIVTESFARTLPADAPRWPMTPDEPDVIEPLDRPALDPWQSAQEALATAAPRVRQPRLVKLSAAWLIEHAGIRRGFALPGSQAAISHKHTLAITNRGEATAAEIGQLARFVQQRVQSDFGVILQPEPVLVGIEL